MNRDTVYAELTKIFQNVFDDNTIQLSDHTTAKDIPQWDSLNHINLVVASEQKFGIRFMTTDITRLANVGEFVDTILKKCSAKA
jgi:acyl carrier protein